MVSLLLVIETEFLTQITLISQINADFLFRRRGKKRDSRFRQCTDPLREMQDAGRTKRDN
jgi:hypothetical protein